MPVSLYFLCSERSSGPSRPTRMGCLLPEDGGVPSLLVLLVLNREEVSLSHGAMNVFVSISNYAYKMCSHPIQNNLC